MICLLPLLIFLVSAVESQVASKTVIDFCSLRSQDCGLGVCEGHRTGNRCRCPPGLMGKGCKRPCQDVYKSCERWKEERRCSWTRPILPFFTDNCALSCGACHSNGKKLPIALPPILENLAWFVGRWEAKTTAGDRFPEPLSGAYREILEVQISEVPAFDRPPVNVSTYAETLDGTDVRREVGFMTSKPFHEDTGFVEFDKKADGDDLVAIESVGNTGLMVIEEGILKENSIKLETKYKKSMIGWWQEFKSAARLFILLRPDLMEERVILTSADGTTRRFLKRYQKTFDYLSNSIKE